MNNAAVGADLAKSASQLVGVDGAVRAALRTLPRAVLCLCPLLVACSEQRPPAQPVAPVEVVAYTVQARRVPVSVELPGRTAAYAVAEIRPQVGGILLKRLFEEGSEVRAGQVLYQIDASAAKANVANALATLASAQAGLASAREKANRHKELVAIEAVSRESADEAEAAYKQAQALVSAGQATLESARLSLGYTNVTSPISGRIGRSSVTQGAPAHRRPKYGAGHSAAARSDLRGRNAFGRRATAGAARHCARQDEDRR